MTDSSALGRQDGQVVDLAEYRARKERRRCRRSDREFYTACARSLRERADSLATDPDGVRRLAAAFDLRRVKLRNYLTSARAERDVTDRAASALRLTGQLYDVLAPAAGRATAQEAAYQLAEALDVLVAALSVKAPPMRAVRR